MSFESGQTNNETVIYPQLFPSKRHLDWEQ